MTSSEGGASNDPDARRRHDPLRSTTDVLVSLLISVVVALMAKTFVIEAFVIPTGSMTPTLLGQHMRFRSSETGADWAVGPWHYGRDPSGINGESPRPIQGRLVNDAGEVLRGDRNPRVTDPMTSSRWGEDAGFHPEAAPKPLRAGDRILVLKHAYAFRDPRRFEVAVFKNPTDVRSNFIKRIVALPGEQLWLVDGDVFTRPASMADAPAWEGWEIRRKPREVQEEVWHTVFDTNRTPLSVVRGEEPGWWNPPWVGDGWNTEARDYSWSRADAPGDGPAELAWDTETWPITDWNPFNDVANSRGRREIFPVGDVRLGFVVGGTPGPEPEVTIRYSSRGTTWSVRIHRVDGSDESRIAVGHLGGLSTEPLGRLNWDRPIRVRFEHVDQRLLVRVNGTTFERTDEAGPLERLAAATRLDVAEIDEFVAGGREYLLSRPSSYEPARPEIALRFTGYDAVTLSDLTLERDLYYQPVGQRAVTPSSIVTLANDQFFGLGDNSANSEDSRDWRDVDPLLEESLGEAPGVVSRDLLLGKAFVVYFPSPIPTGDHDSTIIPMVDAGRIRAIR